MDVVDAGLHVTVIERRPFAGGRTFSFTNDRGDILDNGQHVFLGCCTAYRKLLARLGQEDKAYFQDRLDVRIVDATEGPARLRESPLPAPFHLLPSLLVFPFLSASEKVAAIQSLLSIRRRELPDDQSFADWLSEHGQSANAIQRLWNLIIVPTCNAPAERVSAAQGGFVFREGLLRTRWGGRLGYPRVPLSEIIPEQAVSYLRQRGAEMRFGTAAQQVSGGVVTSQGERLEAVTCIVAVTADELPKLVPEDWVHPATQIEHAPIVGINLWYDRAVFEGEVLAAIVDGEAHWLFDRTRILDAPGPEHQVTVSISAADAVVEVPRAELAAQIAAKLAKALPAARDARLLRSSVEKIRAATFVPGPSSRSKRLTARTPRPGLFLAGAWTDTGWPDTMESAIRSGHTAARLAQDFVQKVLD